MFQASNMKTTKFNEISKHWFAPHWERLQANAIDEISLRCYKFKAYLIPVPNTVQDDSLSMRVPYLPHCPVFDVIRGAGVQHDSVGGKDGADNVAGKYLKIV